MADGNSTTPSPSAVAAQAQAGAPASQGEMQRICLPCSGLIKVEACYIDAWKTPLTDACVKVEDTTGVVVDGAIRTEPLAAHGQQDGDAPTAPLATLGTTPEIEVAHGGADVSLIPQGGGEADSGMDDLGAALTSFRDDALTKLQPYMVEWEAKGILSIPGARLRGVGKGLSSWYEGEASFWGGVSDKAISAYQSAQGWIEDASAGYDAYVANQTQFEQSLLKWGGPLGALYVYGTSAGETAAEAIVDLIDGIGDLSDYIDIIMTAMRNLASGTVDLMEAALDTLRDLPGDLGTLFAQLIDNGQDWIERMVLIASETSAFENTFHVIMSVAMNMVPNFWSEMVGVVTGFILPEVLIEIILAVIAALTGAGVALLAGRFAAFIAKLRGMARKAESLGVLADILDAFRNAIAALAKIGKGLHDEIEAAARAGADGVARVRRRLNQYKVEVDPNTLGMNGGNIRIVRKVDIDFDHILDGNIAKGRSGTARGTGGHYRRSDNIRVTEEIHGPDSNGITKGRISVRDPETGHWVEKTDSSSFYPDHWSRRQTEQEIASAFQNSTKITRPNGGAYWEGTSPSGVPIRGYYNSTGTGASTAFPIHSMDR